MIIGERDCIMKLKMVRNVYRELNWIQVAAVDSVNIKL